MNTNVELASVGNQLHVRITGKLTKEFYDRLEPAVEEQIAEHGKLRLLVELIDFHGWTAGALWEDIKFDVKHFNDIERLALVGDSKWEQGMAVFCKPFTTAKVKYFDRSELDQAEQWLVAEQA